MPDDAKLPLKTFRFGVNDKTSDKKLDAAARRQHRVELLQRRPRTAVPV
jgi:hypothetical protein